MQPLGYGHAYGKPVSDPLDAVFAALADPTRRAILARLAEGDASVQELAEPFDMSQPAVSKHLKVLENAGLIARGRVAQRRPRRLRAEPLAEATAWLAEYRRFWETRYRHLDTLLESLQAAEKRPRRAPESSSKPSSESRPDTPDNQQGEAS